MKNKLKMIVILGPTSSGKTELSLKLAKKFNGEIISADSRQIYRGMDIATGKIIKCQMSDVRCQNQTVKDKCYGVINNVPHYMIDIVNPDEDFSLAEYKKTAMEIAEDIVKRGKIPFLVGGTGLYIKAVVDNFAIPHVPPNKKLRDEFERELLKESESRITNHESRVLEKFYKKLLRLDHGAKDLMDKNNPRRVIRALEVCLATGKPFSELREQGEQIFDSLQIGLEVPREVLYKRIDKRVDQMISDGLIEETKKLIKKGYSSELPSMSGIGYKEMGEYLRHESRIMNPSFAQQDAELRQGKQESREKMLKEKAQEMKWRTHDYARRQMTWFRKDERIRWVNNSKNAEKLIREWLKSDM